MKQKPEFCNYNKFWWVAGGGGWVDGWWVAGGGGWVGVWLVTDFYMPTCIWNSVSITNLAKF